MSTGADLVAAEATFMGEPYNQTNPGRYTPRSGYKDCSGLVIAGLATLGIYMPPGFGLVSTGLELWCRSVPTLDGKGLGRTIDEAYHTPGALLFIWGYGDDGHVATSRGDNTTIETPAAGHKVGIRERRNVWTGAALVPGLTYSTAPTQPQPPDTNWLADLAKKIAFLKVAIKTKSIRYGDNGEGVEVVQLCLTLKGFPTTVDGGFGPKTLAQVQNFQRSVALVADGVVGPLTFNALTA